MIYIGIDPGAKGGIAMIENGNVAAYPFSEEKIIEVLNMARGEQAICCLEKVGAMPGQGVTSMFHFGENFGFIQGVLKAYGIAYELVTPQKWKKEFSVTSDKNTAIKVCKRLFPSVSLLASSRCRKEHDGMTEALLMAEYARRKL